MRNFFFDYKRLWLQIKKAYYTEILETGYDVFLLIMIHFLMLLCLSMVFGLLILSCLFWPMFIIYYIIFKIIYFAPILMLYNESKIHGEAKMSHKIFKLLKKSKGIPFNYDYNRLYDKIIKINLSYQGQVYNIGFFDFVNVYNVTKKEILNKRINGLKEKLNVFTGDKKQLKQKEKDKTQELYNALIKDIQENNKGE